MTWYWLSNLLSSLNIPHILAHAKYAKAIAYAKVDSRHLLVTPAINLNNVLQKTVAKFSPIPLSMLYNIIHPLKNITALSLEKKEQVAHAIIVKEIARIVFYALKNKSNFNNKFKRIIIDHKKSDQWLRITSPII